jgi:pimeloyl-ACP methyl ester carboxylesterase
MGRSTPPKWPSCAIWAATAPRPFPLLLAGERDSVLSPASVRRAGEILGHARVEIVPGAPHSMYWETPSLFNDAVGRFLADVTAAGVTRG